MVLILFHFCLYPQNEFFHASSYQCNSLQLKFPWWGYHLWHCQVIWLWHMCLSSTEEENKKYIFYVNKIIDTCKSPCSLKDWFSLSPAIIIQHHRTPFTCLLEGLHGKYFCMSVSWLAGKVWGLQQCNLARGLPGIQH